MEHWSSPNGCPQGCPACTSEERNKVKLWEHEHPYYMAEGCHFEAGMLQSFENFKDFLTEWENADKDFNRIHRWDFTIDEETGKPIEITFYYVMQRKGYTYSVDVKISEDDESAILNFLKPHAEINKKLWEGIL